MQQKEDIQCLAVLPNYVSLRSYEIIICHVPWPLIVGAHEGYSLPARRRRRRIRRRRRRRRIRRRRRRRRRMRRRRRGRRRRRRRRRRKRRRRRRRRKELSQNITESTDCLREYSEIIRTKAIFFVTLRIVSAEGWIFWTLISVTTENRLPLILCYRACFFFFSVVT